MQWPLLSEKILLPDYSGERPVAQQPLTVEWIGNTSLRTTRHSALLQEEVTRCLTVMHHSELLMLRHHAVDPSKQCKHVEQVLGPNWDVQQLPCLCKVLANFNVRMFLLFLQGVQNPSADLTITTAVSARGSWCLQSQIGDGQRIGSAVLSAATTGDTLQVATCLPAVSFCFRAFWTP